MKVLKLTSIIVVEDRFNQEELLTNFDRMTALNEMPSISYRKIEEVKHIDHPDHSDFTPDAEVNRWFLKAKEVCTEVFTKHGMTEEDKQKVYQALWDYGDDFWKENDETWIGSKAEEPEGDSNVYLLEDILDALHKAGLDLELVQKEKINGTEKEDN